MKKGKIRPQRDKMTLILAKNLSRQIFWSVQLVVQLSLPLQPMQKLKRQNQRGMPLGRGVPAPCKKQIMQSKPFLRVSERAEVLLHRLFWRQRTILKA